MLLKLGIRKRLGGEKGQSLVELAFALPLLAIILLGAIDFGRVFYAYITIINASREGARYGSSNPTDTTGIKDQVIAEATGTVTIDPNRITVTCDPSPCGEDSDSITVRVEADFDIIVAAPFLPWGNTILLRTHTTMPVFIFTG
ncbi:MAG: pilus assembly protein [Chloroflexi bacterium]|nr:pilus assembly protein [Chloroflexota bacterium]